MKKYIYKFKNQLANIQATFKTPIIFEKGLNTETQKLLMTIKKLEKALDKACGELSEHIGVANLETGICYETKEQWKEYLLNESEKQ